MLKNCDLTDYPKVYDLKYWGQFRGGNEKKNIYENRNKFIKDYNINIKSKSHQFNTSHALWSNKELRDYADHTEYYLENDTKNIIIITSPYRPDSWNYFESIGWTEIYPLYNSSAKTFIKIFKPRNIYEQLNPKKK